MAKPGPNPIMIRLGPTQIGIHGRNGPLLRGKLMPREVARDLSDPVAALTRKARARARKARKGKADQQVE